MNANKEIANAINDKILKYVIHKSKVIGERVYWACIDKVFEAQQYEEYDMDTLTSRHIRNTRDYDGSGHSVGDVYLTGYFQVIKEQS